MPIQIKPHTHESGPGMPKTHLVYQKRVCYSMYVQLVLYQVWMANLETIHCKTRIQKQECGSALSPRQFRLICSSSEAILRKPVRCSQTWLAVGFPALASACRLGLWAP